MFDSLLSVLDRLTPSRVPDPDQRLRARVLVVLLALGATTSMGAGATRLAIEGPSTAATVGWVTGLALAGLLYFYVRTGRHRSVADALIVLATAGTMAGCLDDGGLRSIAIHWFCAIPLIGGFIGGRLGLAGSTALCLGALGVLFGGTGDVTAEPPMVSRLVSITGAVLYVAAAAWMYERSRTHWERERREVARMKDEWLSVVSHELRTPLTALKASLELLGRAQPALAPEQQQALLGISMRSVSRLASIVDDVLVLERADARSMPLDRTEVRLDALIDEAVDAHSALMSNAGVVIAVDHGHPEVVLHADHGRLLQAVANLLSNASKFSPPGSTVRIRTDATAQRAQIRVQDEGPGIPSEFKERIFERFVQVDASTRRARAGTGLGLAITKSLVELHGGSIHVESEPGSGACFVIDLPCQVEAVAS